MSRQAVGNGVRRPGPSAWALTVLARTMKTHEDRSISLRRSDRGWCLFGRGKGKKERKEAVQKPSGGRVNFTVFSHLFLCFPHGK